MSTFSTRNYFLFGLFLGDLLHKTVWRQAGEVPKAKLTYSEHPHDSIGQDSGDPNCIFFTLTTFKSKLDSDICYKSED